MCAFALSTTLHAQNVVTLQSGGNAYFFNNIDDAVSVANPGDYIYVPGGVWAINNIIHTGVNIVGVGYNPDSCGATGTTKITAPGACYNFIMISGGADNGSFTGVQFLNTVSFGGDCNVGNEAVNNYSFSRCRFSGTYGNICFYAGWSNIAPSTNLFLSENVFDNQVEGYSISGVTATKNIFTNYIDQVEASTFNNNIFMIAGQWKFFSTNNCSLNNNIVIDNNGAPNYLYSNCNGNITTNTIYNEPYNNNYNNTEIGGIYSASPIFVNFTGFTFDVHADYHLAGGSPGIGYGNDGTDVGIYGTAVPFKEGGVPFNPHIQLQSIGTTTDSQGHLPILINVAAQGN